MTHPHAPRLGQGYFWHDLKQGQLFQTFRRTVTETDLVNFVAVTGMAGAMYMDAGYAANIGKGRTVPAALVYAMIEGFIQQTLVQGTSLGMIEVHQQVHEPVLVNDTIWASLTVKDVQPAARGGHGIVDCAVEVFNQRNEKVMSYTTRRMLAGNGG